MKKHVFIEGYYKWKLKPSLLALLEKQIDDKKILNIILANRGYYEISDNLMQNLEDLGISAVEDNSTKTMLHNPSRREVFVIDGFLGKKVPNFSIKPESNPTAEFESNLFESIQKAFPKSTIAERELIGRYLRFDNVIDENQFYRLFAINEFMEFGESNETFKEYSENNRSTIMELLFEMKLPTYSDFSNELIKGYRNSILEFRDRKNFNNDFENFTKAEISRLWEERFKIGRVSNANCSNKMKEAKSILSFSEHVDFLGESEKKLMAAFFKSMEANPDVYKSSISLSSMTVEYGTFVNAFQQKSASRKGGVDVSYYDNQPMKYEISTKLLELAEKISPVDLISVMFAMGSTASAFRSSNSQKAMEAVLVGLKSHDPVAFVKLLTEIVLEHNGPYATAAEWIESITLTDFDFEVGVELAMLLMIKNQKYHSVNTKKMDKNKSFQERYAGKM